MISKANNPEVQSTTTVAREKKEQGWTTCGAQLGHARLVEVSNLPVAISNQAKVFGSRCELERRTGEPCRSSGED